MNDDEFPAISPNVDFNKILPIHQKRVVAFINHFVTTTVGFLHNFINSAESRIMEFEYKLSKIEASLLILELQLSSISSLDGKDVEESGKMEKEILQLPEVLPAEEERKKERDDEEMKKEDEETIQQQENPKLKQFIKMVQVGVPIQAVKLKMELEGLDSSLIDKLDRNVR